jgi:hypothetical protein
MVGSRAKVLEVGWGGRRAPQPRACALSCPSPAVYGPGHPAGRPSLRASRKNAPFGGCVRRRRCVRWASRPGGPRALGVRAPPHTGRAAADNNTRRGHCFSFALASLCRCYMGSSSDDALCPGPTHQDLPGGAPYLAHNTRDKALPFDSPGPPGPARCRLARNVVVTAFSEVRQECFKDHSFA